MFRRAVMKVTTFLVFAFFCCLLVIRVDKEITSFYKEFGKTCWVMIKRHECISIILAMGMLVVIALIVQIVQWIFEKEKEKKREQRKEKTKKVEE